MTVVMRRQPWRRRSPGSRVCETLGPRASISARARSFSISSTPLHAVSRRYRPGRRCSLPGWILADQILPCGPGSGNVHIGAPGSLVGSPPPNMVDPNHHVGRHAPGQSRLSQPFCSPPSRWRLWATGSDRPAPAPGRPSVGGRFLRARHPSCTLSAFWRLG